MCKNKMIPILEAAKLLDIHPKTLMKRLDYINYEFKNKHISEDYIKTVLKQREDTINIKTMLNEYYNEIKGKNASSHILGYLFTYALGFDLWGAKYVQNPLFQKESYRENTIYVYKNNANIVRNYAKELIILNAATNHEKFQFLIFETDLQKHYETVKLLIAFFDSSDEKYQTGIIEISNYFRYKLEKEFVDLSNIEVEALLKKVDEDLSGPGRKVLVEFHSYCKENGNCKNDATFKYNKHLNYANATEPPPYDLSTYFSIAYMTINKEYYEANNMIQKAIDKESCAKTWLDHLMHFICSWRRSDIFSSLKRFELPDSPTIVFDKVKNNIYTENEYIYYAETIEHSFNYSSTGEDDKPQKESEHKDTPKLRLNIPKSYKSIFGMLALLCEAHNQINKREGSLCEMSSIEQKDGVRLYGEKYSQVLNGKLFSNLRANKSFLNKISNKGNETGTDGYLLASYARSHTGGLDKIPEVTSRYLRAKMDGYSPDEIVMCLMERGVCSFVPYLLCSAIDKERFTDKHITEQTSTLKSLSISPTEIDNILGIDERLKIISKNKVNEIIKWANTDNLSEIVMQILENIIDGECYGKEYGIYCLSKACFKGCVQKQRKKCIGCGNEMYVKSVLLELSQEIFKQKTKLDNARTDGERFKRTKILEERLYPASYEILSTIKNIYHEDIMEYTKILERNDQYAIISND